MSCCICQKSKTTLVCGICEQNLCKSCTEFVDGDQFAFLKTPPEFLKSSAFCTACYIEKVEPELNRYNSTLAAAREIAVFEISQGKETRHIKRLEEKLVVTDCLDKEETLLRLAFFAAQMGYNSLVDTDITPKKIRDGSYQHTIYNGTAIPANVSEEKLMKDRSFKSNPN